MRILIVDNNVGLCQIIREYLEGEEGLTVVGEAYDGENALALIEQLHPDVIILDITMPQLDGLGVMERLITLGLPYRPCIIVLTAFGTDALIARMNELGADYFILKPFNLKVLADRIRQFSSANIIEETAATFTTSPPQQKTKYDVEAKRLLHQMGVPSHLKGFIYLRDAIIQCAEQGYLSGGLSKELYPKLAEKYHTSTSSVEAAIRNAIIATWDNGNREFLVHLCGNNGGNKVPTNSVIIAKLAERIHVSI